MNPPNLPLNGLSALLPIRMEHFQAMSVLSRASCLAARMGAGKAG